MTIALARCAVEAGFSVFVPNSDWIDTNVIANATVLVHFDVP